MKNQTRENELMNQKKLDISLFCEGVGCALASHCHRYVDGRGIRRDTPGYSWMHCCNEEERNGYVPMS